MKFIIISILLFASWFLGKQYYYDLGFEDGRKYDKRNRRTIKNEFTNSTQSVSSGSDPKQTIATRK